MTDTDPVCRIIASLIPAKPPAKPQAPMKFLAGYEPNSIFFTFNDIFCRFRLSTSWSGAWYSILVEHTKFLTN